jgi:riboflavin transporter
MRNFIALFSSSYRELKNIRCITLVAMLGAISIVLGMYLTIMPVETMKISFTFLPNEFVYYLFGPVVGAVYGAALDILTFVVRPTGPFFYGFTVSAILTGFIYGIILYRKPLSLMRIITAKVIHMVAINLILNTYWLTLLYGSGFLALLPMRLLKAVIMLPVETLLLYSLIKGVEATGVLKGFRNTKTKIS